MNFTTRIREEREKDDRPTMPATPAPLEVQRFTPAGNMIRDLADQLADQQRDDASGNGAAAARAIELAQERENEQKFEAYRREREEARLAEIDRMRPLIEAQERAARVNAALGNRWVNEVVAELLDRVSTLEAKIADLTE